MRFRFGADPELFVTEKGRFVSGHGMIPGDKKNPHPVKFGAVQVDGMALEFNIVPAEDEGSFVHNLVSVMDQMKEMIPGYELNPVPCADFDKEVLAAQPEEALMLGCEPDFNAWTGEENPRPDAGVDFRTGSGHVHIGWTEDQVAEDAKHRGIAFRIARQMDFYLGLPSLFFDADNRRRFLYGKAGACRIKPYGVEYRVLSNSWLSSKERMGWVYRSAEKAMKDASNGIFLENRFGDIQHIINAADVKEAKLILDQTDIAIPA